MKVQNKYITVVLLLSATLLLTPPQCFAEENSNAQIIQDCSKVSLDQPCVANTDVVALANIAAIAVYSYNYHNYNMAFKTASQYFTADGWENFMKALVASGNLNSVITKQINVSAVTTQAAVIMSQGVAHGIYTWQTQQQILVTYKSKTQIVQQALTVLVTIWRTPASPGTPGMSVVAVVAK